MFVDKIHLIIIAMDEEFDCLLKSLEQYEEKIINDEIYYFFNKKGINYLATKGKIGKVNTAFNIGKISQIYQIEKIYNLGTSGGCYSVKIGDVVIAREVKYLDVDVTAFNYELGQVPAMPKTFKMEQIEVNEFNEEFTLHYGLIGSSDSFITKKNYHHFFIKENKPLCIEMEAGAVSQCAYLLNVPCVIIRSISDIIFEDDNSSDFDKNLKLASTNCVKVLLSLIS